MYFYALTMNYQKEKTIPLTIAKKKNRIKCQRINNQEIKHL